MKWKSELRSILIAAIFFMNFISYPTFAAELTSGPPYKTKREEPKKKKLEIYSKWMTTGKDYNRYKLTLKDLSNLKENKIVEVKWYISEQLDVLFEITFGSKKFRHEFMESLNAEEFLKIEKSINISFEDHPSFPSLELIPYNKSGGKVIEAIVKIDTTLTPITGLLNASWKTFEKYHRRSRL